MAGLVSLGRVWPDKGFIGMEANYLRVLQVAFNILPPVPAGLQLETSEESFRAKIHDWSSGGVNHSRKAVQDLAVLKSRACNRLLVISNITFDPENHTQVQIIPTDMGWRWEYYPFAFAIYWGLSYHLTNEELEQLPSTWMALLDLARKVHHPELKKGTPAWQAFMLALYERTLGMEFDIKKGLPHYDENILFRDGLGVVERRARVDLFRNWVAYCKAAIEKELLS